MILYLMRHAEALSKAEAKVDSDGKRPLSAEGIKNSKKAAQILKKLAKNRLKIFSSPLIRARQTSELVARELGNGGGIEVLDELDPINAPAVFLKEFLSRNLKEDVLAVGHHPHLGNIASELIFGKIKSGLALEPGGILVIEILNYPVSSESKLLLLLNPSSKDDLTRLRF